MQTLKMKASCARMATAPRSARMACRCQASRPTPTNAASLALAAALLPLQMAMPAVADETSSGLDAAIDTAGAAAAAASPAFTPSGLAFAFSPIAIYGLFWLYREKLNPKANFGDLIFIIAALVVFGNIFSILVFKTRIY